MDPEIPKQIHIHVHIHTHIMYMHMYMYLYMSPCSFLIAMFGEESVLGTCSWKNEHCNFGTEVKASTFLKMAPQAKPLCPRDRYRNSE